MKPKNSQKSKISSRSRRVTRPVAKAKAKRKQYRSRITRAFENNRLWIGADLSLHSLALAALGWDDVLKKHVGPCFHVVNFTKNDHYFDRLKRLANCHLTMIDLIAMTKMLVDPAQIFIAQEEPWPFGMANRGKGQSQTLKQQAEMSGAFLGGLLRYGYTNVYQIHNTWWRKIVADDLGITIHHSKWGTGITGKMRPKEWALSRSRHSDWLKWPNEIPVWPDMIMKDGARVPQPKNSKAKPIQPDDRYQALPMAVWMMREERNGQQ